MDRRRVPPPKGLRVRGDRVKCQECRLSESDTQTVRVHDSGSTQSLLLVGYTVAVLRRLVSGKVSRQPGRRGARTGCRGREGEARRGRDAGAPGAGRPASALGRGGQPGRRGARTGCRASRRLYIYAAAHPPSSARA